MEHERESGVFGKRFEMQRGGIVVIRVRVPGVVNRQRSKTASTE